MTESRAVVAWEWEMGATDAFQRGPRKLWGLMEMFIVLIVMMALWECPYVKTHQIVHFK